MTFENNKAIKDFYRPLSTSVDIYGKTYVSTMEAYKYPFYGVQFHPEKYSYSFKPDENFLHTRFSIENNRYFADFFIGEAKKNDFKFDSYEEECDNYVEHYDVVPTLTYYGSVYAFKWN